MALNHAESTPVERSATRVAPVVERSDSLRSQVDLSIPENTAVLDPKKVQVASIRGFNEGQRASVTDVVITDGDTVIAGSDRKPLSENSLNAAKVKKGEGYFQSAERLLGGEFTHSEKKQFTNALKKSWATDHPDAKILRRGDELLTEKNRDAVLNNIEDPALRARMAERLNKGLPEGDIPKPERRPDRRQDQRPEQRPEQRQENGDDPSKRTTPERTVRKPVIANPEGQNREVVNPLADQSNVPDGPIKNPLDAKFNEGDRFTGVTSTYGREFNGRKTASGLVYNNEQMTAASRELPFGTILSVYNPATKKEVQVVITDKGPFAGKKEKQPDGRTTYERVVDLSTRADRELGKPGLAPLQYKILHIPENGEWGMKRPVLQPAGQRQLEETVRRMSRR